MLNNLVYRGLKTYNGDLRPRASGNFQFATTTWPEMGYKFRGDDSGDSPSSAS